MPLPLEKTENGPLDAVGAARIAAVARQIENRFGIAQDVEWTLHQSEPVILQSRPITAALRHADDRSYSLGLHRRLEQLEQLRERIEQILLPEMEREAGRMAQQDPAELDDRKLVAEVRARRRRLEVFEADYRTYCIPMAHGIRLFGTLYNDTVKPDDPFEFVNLLTGSGLRAVKRNSQLRNAVEPVDDADPAAVRFYERLTGHARRALRKGLDASATAVNLRRNYLNAFPASRREYADRVLEMGYASYRLRDNDNISLGKIRRQVELAETELQRRGRVSGDPEIRQSAGALQGRIGFHPASGKGAATRFFKTQVGKLQVRQYQGQPAAPGVVEETARIVTSEQDLELFLAGEILVCDAIDPAMTFVVPLAAGIVERRGGMLIHGAIIAREYGLPCVTGLVEATRIIANGDRVTVDGDLGLVTIHSS